MEIYQKNIVTEELLEEKIRESRTVGFNVMLDGARCSALLFILLGVGGYLLFQERAAHMLFAAQIVLGAVFLLICRFLFKKELPPDTAWGRLCGCYTTYTVLNLAVCAVGPFVFGVEKKVLFIVASVITVGLMLLFFRRYKAVRETAAALHANGYAILRCSVINKKVVAGGRGSVPQFYLYFSDGNARGAGVSEKQFFALEEDDACYAVSVGNSPVLCAFNMDDYELSEALSPYLSPEDKTIEKRIPGENYNPFFIKPGNDESPESEE